MAFAVWPTQTYDRPFVGAEIHREAIDASPDQGPGPCGVALILALIAILAITALLFLSGHINTILSTIGNKF